MQEKRKYKRLELKVTIQLESIDYGQKTARNVEVKVKDISRAGIGFNCSEKLGVDGFYNTMLEIWTKEVIPCVIHIVREASLESGEYNYGGTFVGMSEIDQRKIDIYQLIEELLKEING